MKTAIFLYGQYRHADLALPLWYGFNEIEADYYVATWDYTKQIVNDTDNNNELFRHEKKVTEEDILKLIPDATLFLDDEYRLKFATNHAKMYFLQKKCLEMCIESGKKYDIVLVMRLDAIYQASQKNIDTLNHIKQNTLYFPGGLEYVQDMNDRNQILPIPFINDVFFYGTFDTIHKIITSLPDRPGITNIAAHNTYAKRAIQQKIHIERSFDVFLILLRPYHIDILKSFDLEPHSKLTSDIRHTLYECNRKYESYVESTHYASK